MEFKRIFFCFLSQIQMSWLLITGTFRAKMYSVVALSLKIATEYCDLCFNFRRTSTWKIQIIFSCADRRSKKKFWFDKWMVCWQKNRTLVGSWKIITLNIKRLIFLTFYRTKWKFQLQHDLHEFLCKFVSDWSSTDGLNEL